MNYGLEYTVCQEFLQLIANVLHVHIYLYWDKRINDAEEYIMAVKQPERRREKSDVIASGSEQESYQSGSMHVNESIDRGADRYCIYNTGEG